MRLSARSLLLGVLLLAALTARSARAFDAGVAGVGTVGITVSNLDRAVDFYQGVLGFEQESETEVAGAPYEALEGVFGLRMRVARLHLGDERIVLTQYLAPEGRPVPPDSKSNDRWFQHLAIVVSDMDRAYAQLRRHDVRFASPDPQRLPDWNPNAGGIRAFYFKDPDGHSLELIWFPRGKGDPRWQRDSDKIFLGIDHTAIVVADTDASLAFYRDGLGLRVVGESENYGEEQARLNNVVGAHLRITALRAPAGPGIELLEYLAPRNGRPRPEDAAANDLLHWETAIAVADVPSAATSAMKTGGRRVSTDLVELPEPALGFRRGLLVADPDGHVLRLAEEASPTRRTP